MPEDTSFIQKLRMNNIFPPGSIFPSGGGDIDIPSMMGNIFSLRQREKDLDLQRQLNLDNEMRARARQEQVYQARQPGLYGIADKIRQPEQPTQMRFQESGITPYQQAQLALSRERLGQTGRLGEERIETTRRGQDISQRRAELAEKIASGRATDEEKHEYRMSEIATRGDIQRELTGVRGEQAMERIGAVTERGRELAGTRGEQRLGEIEKREELVRGRPQQPTQTRASIQNNISRLMLTRPDLSKYIITTPEGDFQVDPDTPFEIMTQIQSEVFGKQKGPARNIELPTEKKTTPTTTTPTVKSKYRVTVE